MAVRGLRPCAVAVTTCNAANTGFIGLTDGCGTMVSSTVQFATP
jgi:hypothetical protein